MRRLWEDKWQVPCHLGRQVDLILSGGGTGEDIHGRGLQEDRFKHTEKTTSTKNNKAQDNRPRGK